MNLLISGGTGSFAQAFVRKLFSQEKCPFEKIIIYSRDEQKQEQMYKNFNYDPRLRMFLGDVRDKDRLKLALYDIDYVIHAAALKIVPALEYNPFECLKTNVIGTQNIIDAIYDTSYSNSKKVILISTDKAVSPYNLYGASKACAEKLIIAANNVERGHKFSVVRYGNVANSRGSVIPLFESQMQENNYLTVTDEKMTRFWITLPQATDFVLKTFQYMEGGEIFIPRMNSFRITDLAKLFCKKYNCYYDNSVKLVGRRFGEKIHEKLISEEESDDASFNEQDNYYMITKFIKDNKFTRITSEYSSQNHIMPIKELSQELSNIGVLPIDEYIQDEVA